MNYHLIAVPHKINHNKLLLGIFAYNIDNKSDDNGDDFIFYSGHIDIDTDDFKYIKCINDFEKFVESCVNDNNSQNCYEVIDNCDDTINVKLFACAFNVKIEVENFVLQKSFDNKTITSDEKLQQENNELKSENSKLKEKNQKFEKENQKLKNDIEQIMNNNDTYVFMYEYSDNNGFLSPLRNNYVLINRNDLFVDFTNTINAQDLNTAKYNKLAIYSELHKMDNLQQIKCHEKMLKYIVNDNNQQYIFDNIIQIHLDELKCFFRSFFFPKRVDDFGR